jgi:hypothetical protein
MAAELGLIFKRDASKTRGAVVEQRNAGKNYPAFW